MDEALGETEGPWFLGGEAPSLVDLQYVSHVERMLASLLYWKALPLRGTGKLPRMDAWLAAFEARPEPSALPHPEPQLPSPTLALALALVTTPTPTPTRTPTPFPTPTPIPTPTPTRTL